MSKRHRSKQKRDKGAFYCNDFYLNQELTPNKGKLIDINTNQNSISYQEKNYESNRNVQPYLPQNTATASSQPTDQSSHSFKGTEKEFAHLLIKSNKVLGQYKQSTESLKMQLLAKAKENA